MLSKVPARLSEPSSYAGLAAILMGLDQLFNLHGVPQAAQVVADAGKAVAASGGNMAVGIATLVLGAVAFLKPDKGKK